MRAKLVLSRGRCSTGDEWMNEANGSLTSIAIKNLLKHFVLSGERHALPLSLVLNNCVCLDVRAFLNPGPLGSKFYQFFSEFSSLWNFFKKGFFFFLSCRTNNSATPVLSLHSLLHTLSALFPCLTLRNIFLPPLGMFGVLRFSASPDVIL